LKILKLVYIDGELVLLFTIPF